MNFINPQQNLVGAVKQLQQMMQGKPIAEPKPKVAKKTEPEKIKHKEFVRLTAEEYSKLLEKFGPRPTFSKIDALNEYIGSTGKKYKSHYHTILMWARKDAVGKPVVKTKADNDLTQWNKNRQWVEQSTLAQLKAHPTFMANMANDKFRAWAIEINPIVKEITL